MSNLSLYLLGMRHGIPIVFGYIPVGIAYAVSALQAGFSPFETLLMSMTVYSGSGQVLGVGMTAQGASLAAIFIATFLINFRYFIMSACIFNRLPQVPVLKRMGLAWFVVDETFALFTTADNKIAKLPYLLGIISLTYSAWVGGAAIGIAVQAVLPSWIAAGLGIALYTLFIAIVVPGCTKSMPILCMVVICAVLNIFLSMLMDGSWAIVISTLLVAAVFALFPQKEQKDNASAASEQASATGSADDAGAASADKASASSVSSSAQSASQKGA